MVAWEGFGVHSDTIQMSNDEITVMGTTGEKPKMAVPPGVLVSTSQPFHCKKTMEGPGAGAGIAD